MGEATYYAKIWFERISKDELEQKVVQLKELLKEGSKAEDYWQHNRNKTPEQFWPKFKEEFPNVTRYLDMINRVDADCNNALAGRLDFGDAEYGDLDNVHYCFDSPDNCFISYYATVWHFADWDPLFRWLQDELGGIDFSWVSDEYVDIFDCVQRGG